MATDFSQLTEILDQMLGDTSIPRNVRSSIQRAKDSLEKPGGDEAARMSLAIYALDEVVNDINIPMYARTMIWNIVSELETMKASVQG